MHAAVDLERHAIRERRPHPGELLERRRDQLLRSPAGVDAHAQSQVEHVVGDLVEASRGSPRADGGAGAAPSFPDRVQHVVELRRGFEVHRDVVRPGARDVAHVALGLLDHQVSVDDAPGVVNSIRDGLNDHRSERDGRDEMAVHHVDMDHPRAGRQHLVHLRAQP